MKRLLLLIVLICNASVSQTFTGTVFLDKNNNGVFDAEENPMPNILVSNGKDVVKTGSKGKYKINAIPGNLVFIIKPSGYISKLNKENTVQFYFNPKDVTSKEYNFPLYKNDESPKSKIAFLGDVQVDVIDDVHHVGKLVTEELAINKPDFIMPLGDLSFDNLNIFNPLSKVLGLVGVPVFYVIGNHDLNFDKVKFRDRDSSFEANFGPSYYAFEYGKNLFLVLNNINPLPNGKYNAEIDNDQMSFIKSIISLNKTKYEAINLAMHIPFDEVLNKDSIIDILKPFKDVFIASGHTHTQYHNYYSRGETLQPIHEIVCGAVCGSWWQGAHDIRGIPFGMMYDGTPKGYWFMFAQGSSRSFNYKVSGAPDTKQMNIWVPEVNEWDTSLNTLNEPYIYANVFAADSNTKVEISFNNKNWHSMQYHYDVDPQLKRFYKIQELGRYNSLNISKSPKPVTKTKHLWRIKIPDSLNLGAYLINIKAKNTSQNFYVTGNRVLFK